MQKSPVDRDVEPRSLRGYPFEPSRGTFDSKLVLTAEPVSVCCVRAHTATVTTQAPASPKRTLPQSCSVSSFTIVITHPVQHTTKKKNQWHRPAIPGSNAKQSNLHAMKEVSIEIFANFSPRCTCPPNAPPAFPPSLDNFKGFHVLVHQDTSSYLLSSLQCNSGSSQQCIERSNLGLTFYNNVAQ